ncbi:MAG TPA: FG-GAP repeat protein [Verrucomicrobiae bacterium]|nr:FG-GAP repeat protein [Verrucomicrobiae bacterium]
MRTLWLILALIIPLSTTAQSPVLLRAFNNPSPAADDYFGMAMAALGNDRVLIGATSDDTTGTNAGIVYLFHTNRTLLTTFTNPNPVNSYYDFQFGCAIATLGSDHVLIGSPQSGKVYLFTTNGAVVKVITLPQGYDSYSFGAVVVPVGNDKVLIGAPNSNFDRDLYIDYGAAYLCTTNGALLTTFSNPNLEADTFGFSLAALGSDRVLIGANGGYGVAYLFSTNGTLLTTITNPTPGAGDYFANSVAAVGTDRILVGAYGDDTLATDAGSVYVFNTNGTLLNTISNPTPAVNDRFGARMAMLGSDRVLINATGDDTAGPDAGSAYVFNLDGTLLATITNPAPASGDLFGFRLAAFGSEGVIIGAPFDDAGATNAGSVYLFSIPSAPIPPSLSIQQTMTNTVVVFWPAAATGFMLQQNTNGLNSANWSNVTSGIQNDGKNKTLVVNPPTGRHFYRLLKL